MVVPNHLRLVLRLAELSGLLSLIQTDKQVVEALDDECEGSDIRILADFRVVRLQVRCESMCNFLRCFEDLIEKDNGQFFVFVH